MANSRGHRLLTSEHLFGRLRLPVTTVEIKLGSFEGRETIGCRISILGLMRTLGLMGTLGLMRTLGHFLREHRMLVHVLLRFLMLLVVSASWVVMVMAAKDVACVPLELEELGLRITATLWSHHLEVRYRDRS